MKICFLSDINSVHTQKWISYFLNTGNEVHVISLNDGNYEGASVHSLNIDNNVAKTNNTIVKLKYLYKILKVRRIINEIKPDILNAHYASSYGILGSFSKYHPYVLSVWGSDIYDFPKKSIIHRCLIKYNLKKADYIFSTGNEMRKEILKYVDKDVTLTPFGIDTDFFDGVKKEHEGVVLGITKSLEKVYGIDVLLRAFSKLIIKYDFLTLKIAGKGTQRASLEKLCDQLKIKDKVTFVGFLCKAELVEFYRNIDIAVFPSRQESFGVAALEAQASKVPVVTSEAPGFKDTVINGKTGLFSKIDDINNIQEKLEELIKDEQKRKEMGEEGRRFVLENFKLVNNFKVIEEIFESVVNK